MLKLISTLLIVSFVCVLILAVVYEKTSRIIEEQKQILLEESLQSVLKAARYEKNKEGIGVYYTAFDETGNVCGWCIPAASKGYGADIQMLVGLDTKEVITGIKILEHKETPGLGSKINEIGYKEKEPRFLGQFSGKKMGNLVLVKGPSKDNILAIAGATVSSRAVVNGVRLGVEAFLKSRKQK